MILRKMLAVTAVLGLAGLPASADTLILNDGSRLRGTLISMNRQVVVFDEDVGTNQRNRTRRVRVQRDRVDAVDFTDNHFLQSDNSRSDDSWSSDTGGSYGNLRQRTVAVYADRPWTDTGINVRAGDMIRFAPTGVIQWGPGRQDGPAGEENSPYNGSRPIPNSAGGALIGRIGTGSGDMFYIGGDRGTFRARTSGRLYLGVNDDYLQDNSGQFRVLVEHQ
ncbi:MAG TPA: LecA/PA-IL family lectin [Vicinamibacteria bacterium]|nr:LecA/PA-IL family lectin [Vicinamibacteria bacterium]